MHLCLLVAGLVIAKVRHLLECLADACQVAVAKDAEAAREERQFAPVALHILGSQEADQRLRHGEADVRHARRPLPLSVSLLSRCPPAGDGL